MRYITEQYDLVVCGGGLAGVCAAIAAARQGLKTCLVHNRPVLGGNSSSEIGVTPHGAAAFHAYARETGILSELLIEERAANHAEIYENGWTNSVWDLVLYNAVTAEPNLTVHLNTDVNQVLLHGTEAFAEEILEKLSSAEIGYFSRPSLHKNGKGRIRAVVASVQNAETELTLEAKLFCDCTGDALVAHRAGCEWRMGSESRSELDEPHAPARASRDTMGSSIHILARNIGRPAPYQAPAWALHYEDAGYFYDQGRVPKDERGGFWWIEIGVPYDTIHDNETIRHELTRHALGVWEWMKNRDPIMKERCHNYALDWIGQVPGKRESRRVMGEYFVTEHDIQRKTVLPDEVGFGGWFVDLHTPGGLLANTSEPASAERNYDTFGEYSVKSYCGPYGFPLRALVARDVENLFLAGRCISASHAALGTLRVMATTALMGQAVGTAAAHAIQSNVAPAAMASGEAIGRVQQRLLGDGCFLLHVANQSADDLAPMARVFASSSARLAGAGVDTLGAHTGLAIWKDQPQYQIEKLERRKGQLLAVGHEGLSAVGAFLRNRTEVDQNVEARLYAVTDLWDYRAEPGQPLSRTTLAVPASTEGWVNWKLDGLASLQSAGSFLRLDLLENPNVDWRVAGCVVPGCVGMYEIGHGRMRRFGNGQTLTFKLDPPQSAYPPANVITGVTRPHRGTNLWRSDPALPLPQSISLQWDEPRLIRAIHLTFPGHLLREYHAYAPFYRDPQCPSAYDVSAMVDGRWQELVRVSGNYQRRRVHTLDSDVLTDRVQVVVRATNGDPSAAIYEIRCCTRSQS
jgi:hypothetical protein